MDLNVVAARMNYRMFLVLDYGLNPKLNSAE
jgi:hypothetical protein